MKRSTGRNGFGNVIVRKIVALLLVFGLVFSVIDLNLFKTVVEHQDSSYSYNHNPDGDYAPFFRQVSAK
jgi:hypothetical protein